MKSIIRKVMSHPDIAAKPPILVDIGASGSLPTHWRLLAPYSICIAFDADTREFDVVEVKDNLWKKLFLLNRLVAAKTVDEVDFHLTKSPYCSSALRPNEVALQPWAFSRLFDLQEIVKLSAVDLRSVLETIGIDYIDWYKTDTQGTDLRIFDALPKTTINKIIAADFEPGIIDAYVGEDKLHQLMAYMDRHSFWVSDMHIKGSQRISKDELSKLNYFQRRSIESFLKTAPGWCEISYLNTFDSAVMNCRDYLLGWVFSTIRREHGFAMHLATVGRSKFQTPLFDDLYAFSRKSLSGGYLRFAAKVARKLGRAIFGGA